MRTLSRSRLAALSSGGLLTLVLAAAGTGAAATGGGGSLLNNNKLDRTAGASKAEDEVSQAVDNYVASRIAPATEIDAHAFLEARAAAKTLPVSGKGQAGTWSELTNVPYNSDDPNYRDPVISNSSGGAGIVSGRVSAVAVDPVNPSIVYAGGADGGLWRSTDKGAHWKAIGDFLDSTTTGTIAINPADDSLWYATGENNTAFENYSGTGIYRSTDGGASFTKVGDPTFVNKTIGQIAFDGTGGVYIATDFGLYKGSASGAGTYANVLNAGTAARPYGMSIVNSVVVQPGTNGQVVVANMAWRNGASYNGFYVSRDGGAHFAYDSLTGAINPKNVGRASLAYSADGSKLYTVIEDIQLFNAPQIQNGNSVLMGVYVSNTGDPAGPWNQIADYKKLGNSGSALKFYKGYQPGVQAWYNQFIAVDPADSNHVYVGLEEVFETRNGGSNWTTIAPYWNFAFACWDPTKVDGGCPMAPHSDQHGVAIGGGTLYIGNDGGVYSRSISAPMEVGGNWNDLNATLDTLQYYYAGAGKVSGGDAVIGGLQDNGGSLLLPGASSMAAPFGGDGGDVIIDPQNGNRIVHEYVFGDMFSSTNGGFSPFGSISAFKEITPSCFPFTYAPIAGCDPNPRFIAPFTADPKDVNHWVFAGQYVWDTTAGWDTTATSWRNIHDLGSGLTTTALGVSGGTTYAGWCGPLCNPRSSAGTLSSAGFVSGIDTNANGTWTRVTASNLPNRYVNNFAVDPANPKHVYAVYGGFSRRWIPSNLGAGVGHVYESVDGGTSWTDVSGNLPDAPADDVVLVNGKLVVSTDIGVFTALVGSTSWSRLGSGLPNAAAEDLSVSPSGSYLLLATHGRGLWKIATP